MSSVLIGVAVFLSLAFLAATAAYLERIAKAQERRATVEEKRLARELELFGHVAPTKDQT